MVKRIKKMERPDFYSRYNSHQLGSDDDFNIFTFYRVLTQSTLQKGDVRQQEHVHEEAYGQEQRSCSSTQVKVWLWGSLYPLASCGRDMQYQTTGNPRWNWHIPIHSTLYPLSRLSFRISRKDFVPVSVTGFINGSEKIT